MWATVDAAAVIAVARSANQAEQRDWAQNQTKEQQKHLREGGEQGVFGLAVLAHSRGVRC